MAARRDVTDRPNIVLIVMDDMGYGDMSCFGNEVIRTPNMDRIAARGVRFTNMYAPAAVCTPSRAGLLTGRYAQRVGLPAVLHPRDGQGLPDWEVTIPELLREQGYRTAIYGKWHLGCRPEHNPVRHGFDEFSGLLYSNDMSPLAWFDGENAAQDQVDQAALTGRYTDAAIDFIARSSDEPFFCYVPHTMPHIPLRVEDSFRGSSGAGTYGDVIECLDFHVGRVLDRVAELGLDETTLVIVTSDNGPWFEGSAGGLRGRKTTTYEGGMRVPFVAQWPGRIPPGVVTSEYASFLDLLPTFAGLAGGATPIDRTIDGHDIWPLFTGGALDEVRPFFYFSRWSLNAVRVGPWKLQVSREPERGGLSHLELPHLVNLDRDPREDYDLSDNEPGLVAELQELIERFRTEIEMQRAEAEGRSAGRIDAAT